MHSTTARWPRSRWLRARWLGAAVALLGLVATTVTQPAAPAAAEEESELPIFTSTGQIVDRFTDETWNPTNEFIFPSVFHASEYLEDPLAEWYIYYGPHDAPGGINLMYADSLDGPWTQYAENPIIANEWDDHYAVSHVAAADAIWNTQADELFLYFHGENDTDRYATSSDGIHFEYGDVVMTTDQFGRNATETSYNRVFEHPDPSSGWAYGMFFMVNDTSNVRRIALALSHDGIEWEPQPGWIVDPGEAEGTNVSAADLWEWQGQLYVLYGASTGTLFARTIDPTLTEVGEAEPLYIPSAAPPESGRATSPQVITDEDGTTHLFYETGARIATTIAHAVLDPDGVRDPLNTRPDDPMYAACTGAGSTEFDGDALGDDWSVVRDDPDRYRVEDGALVMPSPETGLDGATLPQVPLSGDTWEVTTEVRYDPTERNQQTGLVLYSDDQNSVRAMWGFTANGPRFDVTWRNDGQERFDSWAWADSAFPPADMGDTWQVRFTHDGEWITTAYSTDGETFQSVGRPIPAADLAATHVGPTAYRGTAGSADTEAAFSWLRFTPSEAELAACDEGEQPVLDPELSLDTDSVTEGDLLSTGVGVTGTGYAPDSTVTLDIEPATDAGDAGASQDAALAAAAPGETVTTDADGSFQATLVAEVQPGEHVVTATGDDASASAPLTVTADAPPGTEDPPATQAPPGGDDDGASDEASGSLPQTGAELAPGLLTLAALALLAGSAMLLRRRRA